MTDVHLLSANSSDSDAGLTLSRSDSTIANDEIDMHADEPRLSLQIPNFWPICKPSAGAGSLVGSTDMVASTASSSASSPRPSMVPRSLSHRFQKTLGPKAVAAAICTQGNRRRRPPTTSDSGYQTHQEYLQAPISSSWQTAKDANSSTRISEEYDQAPTGLDAEPQPPMPSQATAVRRFLSRRRHSRSASAPEPPASSLHIDTSLPLQLPPHDLCAKSQLLAYSYPWLSEQKAQVQASDSPLKALPTELYPNGANSMDPLSTEIRRSESQASFLSAYSNGSWHGDSGDDDPDGQLARALSVLTKEKKDDNAMHQHSEAAADCAHGHGPLRLDTYDYVDEEDATHLGLPDVQATVEQRQERPFSIPEAVEEEDGLAILRHAGPIMACIASFLFDLSSIDPATEVSGDLDHHSLTSPFHHRTSRSLSDASVSHRISSPSQLGAELLLRRNSRRQQFPRRRAVTVAADQDLVLHSDDQINTHIQANVTGLQSLWLWLIPDAESYLHSSQTIDDEAEAQNSYLHRNSSLPSLASVSTSSSEEDFDWDHNNALSTLQHLGDDLADDSPDQMLRYYGESCRLSSGFGLSSFEGSAFQDVGTATEHSLGQRKGLITTSISISPHRKASQPSPLWDDWLVEEPYHRSWSSLFGLASHNY